ESRLELTASSSWTARAATRAAADEASCRLTAAEVISPTARLNSANGRMTLVPTDDPGGRDRRAGAAQGGQRGGHAEVRRVHASRQARPQSRKSTRSRTPYIAL